MNNVSALLFALEQQTIKFSDVIAYIDARYHYTPTTFDNGLMHNVAGTNEGSCKVLAFAKLNGLNELDTLKLFAEHWLSVKGNPQGEDHQNIRQFKKMGWGGVCFQGTPLAPL